MLALALLCLLCRCARWVLELVEVVSERLSIAVIPASLLHRTSSSNQSIMPAREHCAPARIDACEAYEPLTRRRIAEITAATTLAPRVARADEPAVDAEMIANIQKSRDAWKTNAARRGFAFEAGASMPFVKEGTVGAPDRSAPAQIATFDSVRLNGRRANAKSARKR